MASGTFADSISTRLLLKGIAVVKPPPTNYKGRRAASRPPLRSGVARRDVLTNPQIAAQALLGCYVAASIMGLYGFWVAFGWISEDLTTANDVTQGSGVVMGILLTFFTGVAVGALAFMARKLWKAIHSKSATSLRHMALLSSLFSAGGLGWVGFKWGVGVLNLLVPGGIAVFLFVCLVTSFLTFYTNQSAKE